MAGSRCVRLYVIVCWCARACAEEIGVCVCLCACAGRREAFRETAGKGREGGVGGGGGGDLLESWGTNGHANLPLLTGRDRSLAREEFVQRSHCGLYCIRFLRRDEYQTRMPARLPCTRRLCKSCTR